jgi:chemotaxis signal transduction protein
MNRSMSSRAEELRQAFDSLFASPAILERPEEAALLAIRVAGHPYAVRSTGLAGVQLVGRIVPMPGRLPELMGLVVLEGALVPVYGLASVLNLGPISRDSRWLLSCGSASALALAFDHFEGYLRVPESDVYRADGGASVCEYIHEAVRTEAGVRAIIDTALIVRAIERRAAELETGRERS